MASEQVCSPGMHAGFSLLIIVLPQKDNPEVCVFSGNGGSASVLELNKVLDWIASIRSAVYP
jgi:hypothetical protein